MPDPILLLKAMAAAALCAAAVLLFFSWLWRPARTTWITMGSVLGVTLGFYLGCHLIGAWPSWPPREDSSRLMYILVPALVAVELVGALAGWFRRIAWLLRIAIAASAARILLHDTIFITDQFGPGSREWTPEQTAMILGGLAVALAATWIVLAGLARRSAGRAVPFALAGAIAGAGATVMLSGYATGGQLALPLAAAIAGAIFASIIFSRLPQTDGLVGLGVVGLFSIIVIGRFFGQLTTTNAALLFFAPLLCGVTELPLVRRLPKRLSAFLGILLAAITVSIVLFLAMQKFNADSKRSSPGSDNTSIDDYSNFGK